MLTQAVGHSGAHSMRSNKDLGERSGNTYSDRTAGLFTAGDSK